MYGAGLRLLRFFIFKAISQQDFPPFPFPVTLDYGQLLPKNGGILCQVSQEDFEGELSSREQKKTSADTARCLS